MKFTPTAGTNREFATLHGTSAHNMVEGEWKAGDRFTITVSKVHNPLNFPIPKRVAVGVARWTEYDGMLDRTIRVQDEFETETEAVTYGKMLIEAWENSPTSFSGMNYVNVQYIETFYN